MRFVPVDSLQIGMILGRDIASSTKSFMLKRGVTLTDAYIKYLQINGYFGAYISDMTSDEVIYDEVVSHETIEKGINAVAEQNIGAIINVSADMVSQVSSKSDISVDLFDLRSFDDYTFHHSVNVAVYAAAVGKKMELPSDELSNLVTAALCHDLGKSRVPEEIINKAGKLTDEEFNLIKSHPQFSYDILYDKNEVSAVVRKAVLMHHENENGSGYPKGITGEHIPLIAKIIHAVDVYDALTSKRPYKDPYAPADAFEYMIGGIGLQFDEKVVNVMMTVIPAYPPGIDVTLSNGEKALVIAHTQNAFRPKIKLTDGRIVDLSTSVEYKDVKIASSDIMPQDYVGDIESLNEDRNVKKEQTKKIMIVDDSPLFLQQTKNYLENEKYRFISLSSGMAAKSYIKDKGAPDLVIMDVEMPVLDGVATVKGLRRMGYTDLPVIFLSSHRDIETVMRCKEAGAAEYIIKPTNKTYLQERVAAVLYNKLDI